VTTATAIADYMDGEPMSATSPAWRQLKTIAPGSTLVLNPLLYKRLSYDPKAFGRFLSWLSCRSSWS
jgi:hypothetical protein